MQKLLSLFVSFLLAACSALAVYASQVHDYSSVFTTADTSITDTAETLFITCDPVKPHNAPYTVTIKVYGVITTAGSSSGYKMRIRRETITGTALGDALTESVKAAATGTEPVYMSATETRTSDSAGITYVGTLEMVGASGTTTVKQASCEVIEY